MIQCRRCIMNDHIPNITFENGICSYCKIHDQMENEYSLDSNRVGAIINEIKEDGYGKKFDCVVGVSGGCDSSYLLMKCVEFGLRPLAITFDNTWATSIATDNINNICEKLNIELYTYVMDSDEFNDISRSFLYASVPDADVPNDIAIAKLYYMIMQEYDLNYALCGHSFRTEGTVPLGWTYMDGKYIESVQATFGTMSLKTFPNLDIDYWLANIQRKRIRLLYHIEYHKETVKKMLINKFGWQWYGGHHHENEYTKFIKSYLLPKKFGIDKRYVEFSALIRSRNMTKDEALAQIAISPCIDDNFDYVLKRLNLSSRQFDEILRLPAKSYKDYETYNEYFKNNKTKFKELLEKGHISRTFYEKYINHD